MRTIIDLPDKQLEALTSLSRARKVSRAEIIRQAVDGYLKHNAPAPALADAFGAWRPRRVDGLAMQRKLRSEWDRSE